ncbi:MAG: 2-phospho-L-lactate guanylyltransferase [Candidatus Methanofastidiosa archaeon]|nr:2-phospho-L-lactate guanylyltransferase [Candidatus Methanofastidiosa archaeon]
MTLPVLLPLKYLNNSKSRLYDILGDNKKDLVIALLRDMILLLQKFPEIDIYLLTKKENIDILPDGLEVNFIFEDEPDLNRALEKGIAYLKDKAKEVLILPLDLPFVNEADIKSLISISKEGSAAISPSSRDGTSALLLPLDKKFKIQFGDKSFEKHVKEFQKNDILFKILNSDTLFYDLDTPEDILRVIVVKPDTFAYSILRDNIDSKDNYVSLRGK